MYSNAFTKGKSLRRHWTPLEPKKKCEKTKKILSNKSSYFATFLYVTVIFSKTSKTMKARHHICTMEKGFIFECIIKLSSPSVSLIWIRPFVWCTPVLNNPVTNTIVSNTNRTNTITESDSLFENGCWQMAHATVREFLGMPNFGNQTRSAHAETYNVFVYAWAGTRASRIAHWLRNT